jgi:hypothetical protein
MLRVVGVDHDDVSDRQNDGTHSQGYGQLILRSLEATDGGEGGQRIKPE